MKKPRIFWTYALVGGILGALYFCSYLGFVVLAFATCGIGDGNLSPCSLDSVGVLFSPLNWLLSIDHSAVVAFILSVVLFSIIGLLLGLFFDRRTKSRV